MKPSSVEFAAFLSKWKSSPGISALLDRSDFECIATVETGGGVNLVEARDYAASNQLAGRAFAHRVLDDDRVLWDFEFENDAVLFNLRFNGQIRGAIDVAAWRQGVIKKLTSRPADCMRNNARQRSML